VTKEEKEDLLRRRIDRWKFQTARQHKEKVRLALLTAAEPVRALAQVARDRGLDALAEDLMCEAEAFEGVANLIEAIA
jgi:hypothetical protein